VLRDPLATKIRPAEGQVFSWVRILTPCGCAARPSPPRRSDLPKGRFFRGSESSHPAGVLRDPPRHEEQVFIFFCGQVLLSLEKTYDIFV